MKDEEFWKLKPGDIIQHVHSGDGVVVTGKYSNCIIAVRTYTLVNPNEWVLFNKPPKYKVVVEEIIE